MGRTEFPDLKPITSEPWLATQNHPRDRNGALLSSIRGRVPAEELAAADIIRGACFHQLSRPSGLE